MPYPAFSWVAVRRSALRRARSGLALVIGLGTACTPAADLTGSLGPSGPGSLVLLVQGLPAGSAAAIGISSAQGYQHSSTGQETLAALPAGSYSVVALEVLIGGDRYVPAPATQNVTVPPASAVTVEVMYVLVTARLQVSLGGLPAGSSITLSLSGPGGYQHSLTGTALLTGLTPGVYGLHAPSLAVSGDQYQPSPRAATSRCQRPIPSPFKSASTTCWRRVDWRLRFPEFPPVPRRQSRLPDPDSIAW